MWLLTLEQHRILRLYPHPVRSGELAFSSIRSGFPGLGTVHASSWIILCRQCCPVHCRMLSSLLGITLKMPAYLALPRWWEVYAFLMRLECHFVDWAPSSHQFFIWHVFHRIWKDSHLGSSVAGLHTMSICSGEKWLVFCLHVPLRLCLGDIIGMLCWEAWNLFPWPCK